MDKIIFTYIYENPAEPPQTAPIDLEVANNDIVVEKKSCEFKNLPDFFQSYIDAYKKGLNPLLTVDPVIDIEKFAEAVSKCFNLVYQAQNNLTNAHNLLVNLHKELLKYSEVKNEK